MIQYEKLRLRAWEIHIPERENLLRALNAIHTPWVENDPVGVQYWIDAVLFTWARRIS